MLCDALGARGPAVAQCGVVRLHTAGFALTWAIACGSGPPQKSDPVEPPAAAAPPPGPAPSAPAPPAPEPPAAPLAAASPPPVLACEPGAAPAPIVGVPGAWACTRADGARHGRFVALFPDGAIEIDGTYRAGVLDGPWQRHHPGGAIAERGAYAAGVKTGTWVQRATTGAVLGEYELDAGTGVERRWLDTGELYEEIAYLRGARHGFSKRYERDGSLIESARYVRGVLDGPRVAGTLRTLRVEEQFSAGQLTGSRKIWQLSVPLVEESYDARGRLHGPYTIWRGFKLPRVRGHYEHGKRTGRWVWLDREGRVEREGAYAAGKRTGPWLEWAEGRVVVSSSYAAGRPDGRFAYLDRDGRELGSFTIRGGTGTLLTFHANGAPATRQRVLRGVEDGPYQVLSPRGRVLVEGAFRGGVKHGSWTEWTPDGVLLLEQSWERGKLHGEVKKYVDGKLSLHASYVAGRAHGPYAELRDGRPAVIGQFAADLRTGTWTHYAPDGAVARVATYRDGVLEGPWRQLEAGALIEGALTGGARTGAWTRTARGGAPQPLPSGPP